MKNSDDPSFHRFIHFVKITILVTMYRIDIRETIGFGIEYYIVNSESAQLFSGSHRILKFRLIQ